MQDFFPIKIEEGSESISVDIRQDPFAFPEPMALFHWNKDGQSLRAGLSFTYSNMTFDTIKRADAGNYTVSATNFIIGSNIEQVGNMILTGGFFLDVICECTYNLVLTSSEATKIASSKDKQL